MQYRYVIKRYRGILTLALIVLIIDWTTKALAFHSQAYILNPSERSPLLIPIAFGAALAIAALLDGPVVVVATGLFVGGLVGNVAESRIKGSVIDFIPIDFPIFGTYMVNIADLCIFTGMVLNCVLLARRWRKNNLTVSQTA